MSNLTSGNCGCGCGGNNGLFGGNNSCVWIILLLLFCGGNSCGCNNGCNNGCGNGLLGGNSNNGCCDWLIWILILSCFCGNGCNNGCGCDSCSNNCNSCGC